LRWSFEKPIQSTKGNQVNNYEALSQQYHDAMIDAKAIGEHALAKHYYHIHIRYKNLAVRSQADISEMRIR
jgi:hypothetical protein